MLVQEAVRLLYIIYFVGASLFMVFFIIKVRKRGD
jgi:hypothetical protein